jgi:hypothetical protein
MYDGNECRHFFFSLGFVVDRQVMRLRLFGFSSDPWVETFSKANLDFCSFFLFLSSPPIFKCLKRVNELSEIEDQEKIRRPARPAHSFPIYFGTTTTTNIPTI